MFSLILAIYQCYKCGIIIISKKKRKLLDSEMPQNKKQWSDKEIQILISLKEAYPTKKWKIISKEFAKKGYKRSQYECRQKWVNSLDPEISRQPWSNNELVQLFKQYDQHSSQWSLIQKSLPNRTQTRIKNQFYSLLRNLVRFVLRNFQEVSGKQSQTSNKIHPIILQKIYGGSEDFEFLGNRIQIAIKQMGYRFCKVQFAKELDANQALYRNLNRQLLKRSKQRDQQEERRANININSSSDRNQGALRMPLLEREQFNNTFNSQFNAYPPNYVQNWPQMVTMDKFPCFGAIQPNFWYYPDRPQMQYFFYLPNQQS